MYDFLVLKARIMVPRSTQGDIAHSDKNINSYWEASYPHSAERADINHL